MAKQTIGKIGVTVVLPKGNFQAIEVSLDLSGDNPSFFFKTTLGDSDLSSQKQISSSLKRRKHVEF